MSLRETRSDLPVAPPQSPKQVTVSAKSLEEVLEAIKNVADAIAANTAGTSGGNGGGNGGGSGGAVRVPSVVQSRAVLDYFFVNQLLSRRGVVGRVVRARRDQNVVRLNGVPTVIDGVQVNVTQALVTPRAGAAELAVLEDSSDPDPGSKKFTLDVIPDDQELVRIELQTDDGVPVALGPRLAPSLSGVD
jgi:hypothetical protein